MGTANTHTHSLTYTDTTLHPPNPPPPPPPPHTHPKFWEKEGERGIRQAYILSLSKKKKAKKKKTPGHTCKSNQRSVALNPWLNTCLLKWQREMRLTFVPSCARPMWSLLLTFRVSRESKTERGEVCSASLRLSGNIYIIMFSAT